MSSSLMARAHTI